MQNEMQEREQQLQLMRIKNTSHSNRGSSAADQEEREDEDSARSALSVFRAKEEQIERKKMEVKEKFFAQLGRVEEESKRLSLVKQELEGMADPTRKEIEAIRKRIDSVNRQLKPLGQSCIKKEKEYKETLEAFNEKTKEKALLVNRLMELVAESERLRMKKLEELSKTIDSLG
ncbi:transcriptional activator (DUF662) [Rhynchospora pubera]|uniref:RAB6-interacting golgin n=2 Tax=Rhynchospora pubera TaxID=906938 RepID=A0AAV8CDQ4_9POAL|nr:transcriptional activator (DUF662) [Rhynchospora pubera]KAJ4753331.1 transcriptional activator (DUF662) [Rhynchospora pubera]KAJ4764798.1 transcriptional activator (DUF662) [Rhynchospora pubera]KAJ4817513.1 transcriptional activator (DUF662) [Rhynchospora pubera]